MKNSKVQKLSHPKHSGTLKGKEWWRPIEDALNGINLKGLRVNCPRCSKRGLVTTKWMRGPALKPVHMLHFKRGKVEKVCELSKDQRKKVHGKVRMLESDIRSLLEAKKSYVLFSGGKDSLATLVYLDDLSRSVDSSLTAIYVDTTVGLQENTEYVKEICEYLKVDLVIVRPETDYFTLAKKWGIPSFGYRWCCRELKIKPIAGYLGEVGEQKVVFDGIRAIESGLRKNYIPIWFHPTFKCLSVSPIFYWSNDEVISFNNNNGLPRTLLHSLLNTSSECWCGAYKTESDFRKLYDLNREMFSKLIEVEDENNNRYTFIYKNGKRVPLRQLEKSILKEGIADNGNDVRSL